MYQITLLLLAEMIPPTSSLAVNSSYFKVSSINDYYTYYYAIGRVHCSSTASSLPLISLSSLYRILLRDICVSCSSNLFRAVSTTVCLLYSYFLIQLFLASIPTLTIASVLPISFSLGFVYPFYFYVCEFLSFAWFLLFVRVSPSVFSYQAMHEGTTYKKSTTNTIFKSTQTIREG